MPVLVMIAWGGRTSRDSMRRTVGAPGMAISFDVEHEASAVRGVSPPRTTTRYEPAVTFAGLLASGAVRLRPKRASPTAMLTAGDRKSVAAEVGGRTSGASCITIGCVLGG